ncbi:MAG: hypothetical protein JW394_0511 [Nitrospira sp.]|nr:hypothetical protein [Nitrospira sp.]
MAANPLTEIKDDLVLDRIRILKLINQNRPIGLFDSGPHGSMVAQESFGPCQQAVEGNPSGGEKPAFHQSQEGSYQRHDLLKIGLVDHKKLLRQPDDRLRFLKRNLIPSGRRLAQILFKHRPFIGREVLER